MSAKAAFVNKHIWHLDDWLDLSPMAKLVYLTLATSPDLILCGAHEWDPPRLRERIGGDVESIVEAGAELERNHVVVIDHNTREALIRSHMRHDEMCRKPNIAIAAARSRERVVSRHLRGVVVFEMERIRKENPGWKGTWESEDVARLLKQHAVDPKGEDRATNPTADNHAKTGSNAFAQVKHCADGSSNGSPDGLPEPSEEPSRQAENTAGTVTGTVNGTVTGTVNRNRSAPSSSSSNSNKRSSSPTKSSTAYSDEFEAWWVDYPRKAAKAAAAKAFVKAIKLVDLETLQRATRQFAKTQRDKGQAEDYIPHGASWLNGRRWEDNATAVMTTAVAEERLRTAWRTGPDAELAQLSRNPFLVEWPDPMPETAEERDQVRLKLWQQWLEDNRADLIAALTREAS